MIHTHILENGLTILMERLPYLRSASAGIFVKAGSIMEDEKQNGLSHYIEHMAFKGTFSKSAREIAEEIDLIGGNVNAATSKLLTSYYARTMDKDLKRALFLLADLVQNAKNDKADFEKEKLVILEEIAMEADSPEDQVFNLAHKGLFGDQTLSRTILGSQQSVKNCKLDDLISYRRKHYRPGNAVLSVAGRFDESEFIAWAKEAFSGWEGEEYRLYPENKTYPGRKLLTLDKDVEQVHLCLTYPGLKALHEDRYALTAFSTAFGGGVSSRLFQKIREDKGLVYNIYAAPSFYPDCGEFAVYAACTPKNVEKVILLIEDEVADFIQKGVTRSEYDQTMAQLKTGFVLSMESAYQRMASMGIHMLLNRKVKDQKETLAGLRKVSMKKINNIAKQILSQEAKLALVGRKISKQFTKEE